MTTAPVDGAKLREIIDRFNADKPKGDGIKAYKEGLELGFDMEVVMLVGRFMKMGEARFHEFDQRLVAYLSAVEMR